ncbi:head-tail connector protein [Micromonospora sp. SCSIO 07396]
MYDVGDTYPVVFEVRSGGVLLDAADVEITVTEPDGVTGAPVVPAHPSIGRYTYDFPITQHGLHRIRAVATTPDVAHVDVFSAADSSWPAFVGLDEAKSHLNIALTDTSQDDELRAAILSASAVVEDIVGSVSRRPVTEVHSGRGRTAIMLRERPALEITEVSEGGTVLGVGAYSLSDAGVLFRVGGRWPDGFNNVSVGYVAGRTAVPWAVLDGTKELIRINWRPQQGGNYSPFDSSPGAGAAPAGEVRLGFFIPNTVRQRLQTAELAPYGA